MRAIVQHEFGAPAEVLQLADIEVPTVGAGQVLVRVHASSANPWDWHFIRGEPVLMRPLGLGVRGPKSLVVGGDLAGVVEQVGWDVTAFGPGDEVYGFGHGAFAEYVAVGQDRLARKPANLTFEQAAAVPLAAVTALQGVREHGRLESGQRVLIVGASGGIGTFAVQMARGVGAHVTGVCSSRHVEFVRELGADQVIDYTAEDFTDTARGLDLVIQLGGTYSPYAVRKVLARRGILLQSYGDGGRWLGPVGNILKAAALSPFVAQTLKSYTAEVTTEALDAVTALIESGTVTPVIDSSLPLSEAGTAVRMVEEGSPRGKVVVTV